MADNTSNLGLFALAFVPKAPALVSFFSSGYVVLEILRFPERRSRLYHRIVLWMNVSTSIMACCHFMGTWFIPAGTPGVVGAIGNDVTCLIQGALLTCPGCTVTSYYASLSVISYIAVKNDFKEKRSKYVEPLIHSFSVGIPLILVVIGLKNNFFNPAGAWCWVDSFPPGCEHDPEVECINQVASYFRISIVALMYSLTILTLTMMCLIYFKIRRDEKKVESEGAQDHHKKSKVVLLQISLYVMAYVVTYVLIIICRMSQWATGYLNVPLFSVALFLVASQGFLNMIVYILLRNSARYRLSGDDNESNMQMTHRRSSSNIAEDEERTMNESTDMSGAPASRYEFSIFEGTRPSAEIWNNANEVIPVASVSYVNE